MTRQWYSDNNLPIEEIPAHLLADTLSYISPPTPISDDENARGYRNMAEEKIDFKGYEVDPSEEPCLFAGLITLQLGVMRAFLRKMRAGGEESGFLGLVEEVDGRVTRLGRFCSRSCEP